MNRLNHALVAFLALILAIVILGVTSVFTCREGGNPSGLLQAMAALSVLAGVFRPSTQGGANGPPPQ